MKYLIESIVDSAIQKKASPNDAIIEVLSDKSKDMTPELIKRIVESFNTRSFLKRQLDGEDMEESFPIADSKLIILKLFKEDAKDVCEKQASFIENPFPTTDYYNECIMEKRSSIEKEAFQGEYTKEAGLNIDYTDRTPKHIFDTEKGRSDYKAYALRKCAAYIRTFDDCYKLNDQFVSELRYLCPDSIILKEASLDKGKRKIPQCITTYHSDFIGVEKLLNKIAALPKVLKVNPDDAGAALKNLKILEMLETLGGSAPGAKFTDDEKRKFLEKDIKKEKRKRRIDKTVDYAKKILNPFGKIPAALDTLYEKTKQVPLIGSMFSPHVYAENFMNKRKLIQPTVEEKTENVINTLRSRAMFTDLINNDPYLKGSDPDTLLDVYGSIRDIAPDVTNNKEVTRNLLRLSSSHGMGGLDLNTMMALVKAQKNMEGVRV